MRTTENVLEIRKKQKINKQSEFAYAAIKQGLPLIEYTENLITWEDAEIEGLVPKRNCHAVGINKNNLKLLFKRSDCVRFKRKETKLLEDWNLEGKVFVGKNCSYKDDLFTETNVCSLDEHIIHYCMKPLVEWNKIGYILKKGQEFNEDCLYYRHQVEPIPERKIND